jgi:hypothetical protein
MAARSSAVAAAGVSPGSRRRSIVSSAVPGIVCGATGEQRVL